VPPSQRSYSPTTLGSRDEGRDPKLDEAGIIEVMDRRLPLVACSLNGEDQRARLDAWVSLLASAASRAEVPAGMSYVFRPASVFARRVRDLAAAEGACCTFLDFEIVEQSDEVRLTVTSHPTGQAALRFIFT